MVGLVIVSHSAKLAQGVAELMRGMAGSDVQIALAGGIDLDNQPLGTDANLIHRAIVQVYSDEGVVVLVDLGSAILSTELAIEMFPPAQRAHIVIAPAPLVEGGLAAAVQARLGSPLETVVNQARNALRAKLAQLEHITFDVPLASDAQQFADEPVLETTLLVTNRLGLHARPAAKFVRTAARFNAAVRVQDLTNARGPVNAKSINAVTTLGVLQGHQIKILARGADAQDALDALQELARENFGDHETLSPPAQKIPQTSARVENEIVGHAASPGYALGSARLYRPILPAIPHNTIDDPPREWARLNRAIRAAQIQLQQAHRALMEGGNSDPAEIFVAQMLMLQDEALQEPARRAIFEHKINAARAFEMAAAQIASQYDALEDEYLRARAADVRAVSHQVLINLLGVTQTIFSDQDILVAPDLTPAETAQLDPQSVHAICTAYGAPTGHSAILAKSLGIPAVVALGEKILRVNDGDTLIVDGTRGRVWVNPSAEQLTDYEKNRGQADRVAQNANVARHAPALTRDGHRVEIAANIGSVNDARRAVEMGAEAIGLFRTEFLFLNRRDAPGEQEQFETYRAVAVALQNRALVIRTLDIGGDKPLPYVDMPLEANPFLGMRGLRLSLAQPELFKTQLRAILRVAEEFPVRVMFPMVSTLKEFRDAKTLLNECRAELRTQNIPVPEHIETGIMVEVPSAALHANAFAREIDFFSIGTNDLTQYTLAAERGNPNVAGLADSFHPAVLKLIANVVQAAHAHSKRVGVCGEMGGDPRAIPLLVGLGIDELSMSASLIPQAKEMIREVHFADAQTDAQRAME